MDAFPLPSSSHVHPGSFEIQVECAQDIAYDGGDFLTYPERQGWAKRTLGEWLELFQSPPREFSKFMERWLLFGTLHHYFGDSIDHHKLVRSVGEPSRLVLTMLPIRSLLKFQLQDETISLMVLRLASDLHLLLGLAGNDGDYNDFNIQITESLTNCIKFRMLKDPRSPEMVMITAAWLEVLVSLTGYQMTAQQFSINLSLMHRSLMWSRLREQGWCPSDLTTAFHRFNVPTLYFLHNINGGSIGKNPHKIVHVRARGCLPDGNSNPISLSTTLCTPFVCGLNKLNDQTYVTKHADRCGGCENIQAKSEELCGILKRRKIPLIDFEDARGINLVESEPDMPYIAISHVWSDGIGNPLENSLPRCQLQRLNDYIRKVQTESGKCHLFWIDTICVPPDSAALKDVQDLAISLMRETYENAVAVLVLDSSLYGAPSLGRSPAENLIRVFSSRWTSRLWTYQEGALARSLYFQFSDNPLDLEAEISRLKEKPDTIESLTLVPSLMTTYGQIRFFQRRKLSFEERFLAICSSFSDRTTSVASDEPICFGTLLGLDVLELAQTPPQSRIEKFWRMLPCIPESIVRTKIERLDVPGLRWAPKSFLRSFKNQNRIGGPSSGVLSFGKGTVNAIEEGVLVQQPGLLVRTESVFIGTQAYFKVEKDDSWYKANFWLSQVPEAIPYKAYSTGKGRYYKVKVGAWEGFKDIAIVLEHELSFQSNVKTPSSELLSQSAGNVQNALLVAVREEREDIIFCQYVSNVSWEKASSEHDIEALNLSIPPGTGFYKEPVLWDSEHDRLLAAVGKIRPASQYWCMG